MQTSSIHQWYGPTVHQWLGQLSACSYLLHDGDSSGLSMFSTLRQKTAAILVLSVSFLKNPVFNQSHLFSPVISYITMWNFLWRFLVWISLSAIILPFSLFFSFNISSSRTEITKISSLSRAYLIKQDLRLQWVFFLHVLFSNTVYQHQLVDDAFHRLWVCFSPQFIHLTFSPIQISGAI